jgi:hypothetical protein
MLSSRVLVVTWANRIFRDGVRKQKQMHIKKSATRLTRPGEWVGKRLQSALPSKCCQYGMSKRENDKQQRFQIATDPSVRPRRPKRGYTPPDDRTRTGPPLRTLSHQGFKSMLQKDRLQSCMQWRTAGTLVPWGLECTVLASVGHRHRHALGVADCVRVST